MSDNSSTSFSMDDPIRKGRFYFIFEDNHSYILYDKTKRGLEIKDTFTEEQTGITLEKGIIYDMDGRGHKVPIRWLYPKSKYDLDHVLEAAERMEKKYREIRELTCPDSD
ncbi:hypothetical protein [Candidatus Nitrosocosmicus sp. SS]|jgi:hypothetical protein|uniref:hypothetical protein n=1 Tax=Candidatus Nitrosocosmicus agrestis TaxID=2563600 RepID=UPI001E391E70|nr:hypothetical protein [Candidatus Nitrosocosmicus sp. SS]MDR4492626.1 hypothetical protein [Candidatus Nitrosocosmicus sp.]